MRIPPGSLLPFPLDDVRPSTMDGSRRTVEVQLHGLVPALRRISLDQGATLAAALLAAFKVFLYRYSDQAEVVGMPTGGTFLDLLAQVNASIVQSRDHASHAPLFQFAFAFEEPDAHARRGRGAAEFAMYDLVLRVQDRQGHAACAFDFSDQLFTTATMERLADNFATLVGGIVTAPDTAVDELPIIGPHERRLLADACEPAPPSIEDTTVHALFERQVAATPNAVAVVCGKQTLTYAELDAGAEAVARQLHDAGVRPGHRVGLCVTRSARLVQALIGVLKTGAAYVPLDPAYPRARLSAIASDAKLSLVVSDVTTPGIWPDTTTVVVLGPVTARPDGAARRACPQTGDLLSHVIYTSGSTGRPKGVMIRHRSVVALLAWARQTYAAEELARVLFSTSVCFDLSVFELWAPLTRGGAVVVVENALELCDDRSLEVSLVNTVPSALKVLLESGGLPRSTLVVNVAGEPLSKDVVNKVFGLGWVRKVFNLYGPTEDTTYSTFACFHSAVTREPTIGRPIPNTRCSILDSRRRPVPMGAVGELYLGGEGLAAGYLDRPDLTAERFVRDPQRDDPDQRLYRTGDLVRLLPDGQMEFHGRVDNQVKVRGFRIELGEVEAVLGASEWVKDCAVVVDGERMIAFVVLAAHGASLPRACDALRRHLGQQLPRYMVPAAIVTVDELPLTPNGKVDRRGLLVRSANA